MRNVTMALFAFLFFSHLGSSAERSLWFWPGATDNPVDVVACEDGSAWILFYYKGLRRYVPGKAELISAGPKLKQQVTWIGLNTDPKNPGDLVLVGSMGEFGGPVKTVCGIRRRNGKWGELKKIDGTLHHPYCYRAQSGATVLYSQSGTIFTFASDKWTKYDFDRLPRTRGEYGSWHDIPLTVAEAPNGILTFVAYYAGNTSGKAMKPLLLHENKKWRLGSYGNLHPGGSCFLNNETLVMATETGLITHDLRSESQPLKYADLPGDPNIFQRPISLNRLSDGTLISVWRKQPGAPYPMPDQEKVSYVAEYDGTKWTTIDVVADTAASPQAMRPSAVERQGTFWMGVAGGGVLFRTRDGKWGKLDWRDGVRTLGPSRLVVAPDDKLWIVGYFACELIDTRQPHAKKPPTPWSELFVRTELRRGPDGQLCAVSGAEGGSIVTLGPKGPEYQRVPAHIRTDNLFAMSFDSEGGIWLFSGRKTMNFDGKEWHLHQNEKAFQAQLGRGKDFRIGQPEDPHYVVFTEDNRILYQDDCRRVGYFDGTNWNAPYSSDKVGKRGLSDHPFFHDNKVTIHVSGKTYQMENDDWTGKRDDRAPRPWTEIAMVKHPFSQEEARRGRYIAPHKLELPPECPIPKKKQLWGMQSEGLTWVGNTAGIACTTGEGWIMLPTSGTPLFGARRIRNILSDSRGAWYFETESNRPHRYGVLRSGTVQVQPGETDLGKIENPLDPIEFPGTFDQNPDDLSLRHRFDGGPWKPLLPVGSITLDKIYDQGIHHLDIQLLEKKELRRSPTLRYTFEVTYDATKIIDNLIAKLGDRNFTIREKATKSLIQYGPILIPRLKKVDSRDPEVQFRLAYVRSMLEQNLEE